MTREFVSYSQALALKELGFDEPCFTVYNGTNILIRLTGKPVGWCFIDEVELIKHNSSVGSLGVTAPTYSVAFRWFRDVHELEGVPQKADSFSWFKFCIWKYTSNGKHRVNDAFDFEHKTYEEAESACLDKLIEICKNDNTSN